MIYILLILFLITVVQIYDLRIKIITFRMSEKEERQKLYKWAADKSREETRGRYKDVQKIHKILRELEEIIYGHNYYEVGKEETGLRAKVKEFEELTNLLKANLPQNFFDFTKKRRGWRGAWKITPEQKEEIAKAEGTHAEIARRFNICRSWVGAIKQDYKNKGLLDSGNTCVN